MVLTHVNMQQSGKAALSPKTYDQNNFQLWRERERESNDKQKLSTNLDQVNIFNVSTRDITKVLPLTQLDKANVTKEIIRQTKLSKP